MSPEWVSACSRWSGLRISPGSIVRNGVRGEFTRNAAARSGRRGGRAGRDPGTGSFAMIRRDLSEREINVRPRMPEEVGRGCNHFLREEVGAGLGLVDVEVAVVAAVAGAGDDAIESRRCGRRGC
ncbi:hypothetical protein OsJ_25089 [Oryza sativa Japonica Group]|uniref:Uncharacterized protein n=1 Tax=Oryza sativa subsp. japonica TaxID=39947 RepID=Q6YTW1_ORYSJ|nr:hypothetical protein OsJ_25089 [Oryza sativa Japonica Group]BAC84656.1 hypothetical protein [Oryza sativa Japonica Group]